MNHPLTEANLPAHLRAHVVYLHPFKCSKNKLKKAGRTKTEYVTIAKLLNDDDDVVAEGRAACSREDKPNRRVGRAIAIGRAMKEYYSE